MAVSGQSLVAAVTQRQVGPIAGELGLPTPEIREYEVRGYLIPA
jgi:hypothetical protein